MKKLESLNQSLYEKFEKKKINNLVAIIGGQILLGGQILQHTLTSKSESNPNGTDEFHDGTSQLTMVFDGKKIPGDMCYGAAASSGSGSGSTAVGVTGGTMY